MQYWKRGELKKRAKQKLKKLAIFFSLFLGSDTLQDTGRLIHINLTGSPVSKGKSGTCV
tara:strand:+ start:286 stop:462 length:177 start_codon:yes stop_codon:yes gene_type:complete